MSANIKPICNLTQDEQQSISLKVATAFSGGLAAVEFALKYENKRN